MAGMANSSSKCIEQMHFSRDVEKWWSGGPGSPWMRMRVVALLSPGEVEVADRLTLAVEFVADRSVVAPGYAAESIHLLEEQKMWTLKNSILSNK
ncbi:hypothetical protein BV898_18261 [Hypsibius exemplaris]|uniref:Uncharacterized protein n=1 Tax=Hypsibius exemplaris TaxID=2072580 RepID=A0A9X6RNA8_HYPEX|nr:hypothetical protein BV898_18261 [Hypsibius exemplaris]